MQLEEEEEDEQLEVELEAGLLHSDWECSHSLGLQKVAKFTFQPPDVLRGQLSKARAMQPLLDQDKTAMEASTDGATTRVGVTPHMLKADTLQGKIERFRVYSRLNMGTYMYVYIYTLTSSHVLPLLLCSWFFCWSLCTQRRA